MFRTAIKNIILLGRFHFLIGGLLLFCLGGFLAVIDGASMDTIRFLFGYLILFPAHLGLSYSNNYYDIDVDKFSDPGMISGGTKILIDHPELKRFSLVFALILMGLSLIIGGIFTLQYHLSISFFGFIVFGNLLGWFYTAPPFRLAYHGFGEYANMLTMGLLMPGLGFWAMNGRFTTTFLVIFIPFMLYGLQFILTVEIPDMGADEKAHKKTFVVRKGRHISYFLIFLATLGVVFFYGILLPLQLFSSQINYGYLAFLCFCPLVVAAFGIKGNLRQGMRIKTWALLNMGILIFVMIGINLYFITIII
ncbi:MAG: prenyltransferase [Candidatus Thermoplasmatota archaeon]|nr:prenyltransferase [Candidatus Thermoplasmatota archaeon]